MLTTNPRLRAEREKRERDILSLANRLCILNAVTQAKKRSAEFGGLWRGKRRRNPENAGTSLCLFAWATIHREFSRLISNYCSKICYLYFREAHMSRMGILPTRLGFLASSVHCCPRLFISVARAPVLITAQERGRDAGSRGVRGGREDSTILGRTVAQLQKESEATLALEAETAQVNQQLALQVAALQRCTQMPQAFSTSN